MNDQFWVNGDMYIVFNNGTANSVRLWNTPTAHNSKIRLFGLFAQDTWSIKRLTLNLGVRVDHGRGWMPRAVEGRGHLQRPRATLPRPTCSTALARRVANRAWSTISFGNGQTAIKASASRYAAQVGLNMVQRVHPLPVHERHASVDRRQRRPDSAGERARGVQRLPRADAAGIRTRTAPTGRTRTSSPPASSTSSRATSASARRTTTGPTGKLDRVAQRRWSRSTAYTTHIDRRARRRRRAGRHDHVLQPDPGVQRPAGQRVRQRGRARHGLSTASSSRRPSACAIAGSCSPA